MLDKIIAHLYCKIQWSITYKKCQVRFELQFCTVVFFCSIYNFICSIKHWQFHTFAFIFIFDFKRSKCHKCSCSCQMAALAVKISCNIPYFTNTLMLISSAKDGVPSDDPVTTRFGSRLAIEWIDWPADCIVDHNHRRLAMASPISRWRNQTKPIQPTNQQSNSCHHSTVDWLHHHRHNDGKSKRAPHFVAAVISSNAIEMAHKCT